MTSTYCPREVSVVKAYFVFTAKELTFIFLGCFTRRLFYNYSNDYLCHKKSVRYDHGTYDLYFFFRLANKLISLAKVSRYS